MLTATNFSRTVVLLMTSFLAAVVPLPGRGGETPSVGKNGTAPKLSITSPQAAAAVKGWVRFSVESVNLPRLASVEYELNRRTLSGPLCHAPYDYSWHSALAWDGPATIQARARDDQGNVLAESAVVHFTIANGRGSIRMISPNPARVLRGLVKWTVAADRPVEARESANRPKGSDDPRAKPIEGLLFFVDGQMIGPIINGRKQATIELDTTQWLNGRHEFFAAAYSSAPGLPPIGMIRVPVKINNGRTIHAVRSRWSDLFLEPGQTAELSPRLVYTDGTEKALGKKAIFTVDDPTVATVNDRGIVKAVAPGVAHVAIEFRQRKTTARVIVNKALQMPHFSRDGHILTRYEPGRSLFVRSLFGLGPEEIRTVPKLTEAVHAAEINALTSGFYRNPVNNRVADLTAWRKSWEPWWDSLEQTVKDNQLGLVLTGDDIARTNAELANSVGNPWAADALKLAFSRIRDSKRVICVEMVDEVSFWGDTPAPSDNRWKSQKIPVDDDAFRKLMKIINSVRDRPPISWPVAGMAHAAAFRNWLGDPAFADYASLYWTIWDWRNAYPEGASLPQVRAGMDRATVEIYPLLQRDRPILLLTSACGTFYTKQGAGDEFTPGQDIQNAPPSPAVSCGAEIMYAVARGAAGVRTYNFDTTVWKAERRQAKKEAPNLQTGSDPFKIGTDRWQAIASAFHLIRHLEPYFLQPPMHALHLGPSLVTGARQGADSRLLIAVNFSEAPQSARVDLQPYRYDRGSAIERYRLVGATLSVDAVAGGDIDTITFAPGETIVWLFRRSADTKADSTPTIAFPASLQNATVSGEVLLTVRTGLKGKPDRVEFFVNGRSVGIAKSAPYAVTWDSSSVEPGIWHSVSAIAHNTAERASEARIALLVAAGSVRK